MKMLIVGASGFVGKALALYFAKNHEVLTLTRQELDITDQNAVFRALSSQSPNLVFNCAVLGVEPCGSRPDLAHAVNVQGAENLARAAREIGSELVQISTNYVFGGEREDGEFYTINDLPEPINIYGKTKLEGERVVQATLPNAYIIRTSWIFGTGKENFFCRTPKLLQTGQRVQALTDVWASATYLPDLVARLDKIIERRNFGIYHVVNEGFCSYYNFAVESAKILKIEQSEWSKLIEPVTQSGLGRIPARPAFTPLRCLLSERLGFAPMRDWHVALAEFIAQDDA
jgi:dTDP-4-dehydrorhamnose reductase